MCVWKETVIFKNIAMPNALPDNSLSTESKTDFKKPK